MAPATIIETNRLRLRPFHEADMANLVALANDWAVAEWMAHLPYPYTEWNAASWVEQVRAQHAVGNPVSFALALKVTDRLIGGCGLDGSTGDGSAETALGYWLGQPHWGRGYGSEAVAALIEYGFTVRGLRSIRACTDPANRRSQRVLLACGLQPAGEIDLITPTHHGARRVPLFRIERS